MTKSYGLNHYEVHYHKSAPIILLRDSDSYIAQLIFQPNGTTLPADKIQPANHSVYYNQDPLLTIYYHLEDFANVVDLLRNEKPMFLVWEGEGANADNYIKTFREGVGQYENMVPTT